MLWSKVLAPSLTFLSILAVVGLQFGSQPIRWVILAIFILVTALFFVMSDSKKYRTEEEARRQWYVVRGRGKLRYVVRSLMWGLFLSLPLIANYLLARYRDGNSRNFAPLFLAFAVSIGGAMVLASALWYWQEMRYGKPTNDTDRAA